MLEGEIVAIEVLLTEAFTVTFASGCLAKSTVKLSVPPASEVSNSVFDIFTPAVSLSLFITVTSLGFYYYIRIIAYNISSTTLNSSSSSERSSSTK